MEQQEHGLDPNELLTTDEMASILKVEQQTVLSYLKQDMMPYIRIGNRYRVYRRDFDAFLQARYKQPEKKK